jgi:hypothetical protein
MFFLGFEFAERGVKIFSVVGVDLCGHFCAVRMGSS